MFYYRVYGLNIKSSVSIPFLTEVDNSRDVDLHIECVEKLSFTEDKRINLGLAEDAQNNLLLDIPEIAKYKITDDKILICKSVKIDLDSVIIFLVGSAIPYYLAKRGKVVLRGCAYSKDLKSADLILGPSGVGKSTILAAFCQKDYKMLSDQFCVLTQEANKIYVESAFPNIKLWLQATRVLKIDAENLSRVRPNLKRYYWEAPFCSDRLEVRNICKINEQNLESDVPFEKIVGVKKINILQNNVIGKELFFIEKNHKIVMTKATMVLASQANFFKILNIRGKSTIDSLCELIEDKCNEEK